MNVASLKFREAIPRDEAVPLPMTRKLAEQEPDPSPFEESAAPSAFPQFLWLPACGRAWLIHDGPSIAGYIMLTIGFRLEFGGQDAFIDERYMVPARRRRGIGRAAMAFVV